MKSFCVYCHTSPSNKKYVGISKAPLKRWNEGRGYEKNYRFYRAIQKYGWSSFKHEIIADELSIEDAKALEIELISKWKLTDFRYGYNLREGGDGPFSEHSRTLMSLSRIGNTNSVGHTPTKEVKEKISQSLSEYYSTHENPMKGKHHTEETIAKLKARVISDETKLKMRENHADVSGSLNPSATPIRQLSPNGELIAEYPYAKMASREYNLDLSSIIKCCRGKLKTCGGYRWEYI